MTARDRDPRPPRIAERLMRLMLGGGPDGGSINGDLHEEYRAMARRAPLRARVWYWAQLLTTGVAYARPGRSTLDRLRQDLAIALRGLRREPGFTLAVVVTLALAIGAGTAIFTVVDGVLLRPLPYAEPDRLYRVWASNDRTGDPYVDFLYADVDALAGGTPSLGSIAGLSLVSRVVTDESLAERDDLVVARTTHDLFATLGVAPAIGRVYDQADARSGAAVVVVSHELWRGRLGADPAVLGGTIRLDTRPYTIIGVLEPGAAYPEGVDVWRPLTPDETADDDREAHVVARLADGARASTANAEVAAVAASLAAGLPESHDGLSAWVQPLRTTVVRDVRTALYGLLGAVGVVLLIACLNTANLLLARSQRRRHEVAIRTALGAGRGRIVSLRLTESLVLAGLGGLLGLPVGQWALSAMLGLGPGLPRADSLALDLHVVGVMALVTAAAGVLFGVAPALHSAAAPPERTLREAGISSTAGRSGARLRAGLVTGEIALSTVLAVLALLLASTFRTAITFDRGFAHDDLVAITLDPQHPPEGADAIRALFYGIEQRVERLGGVRGAALSSHPLLEPRGFRLPVAIEDEPVGTPTPEAYVNAASPDFFETVGIAFLDGGGFSEAGGVDGDEELIVNERFALAHLAGRERRVGTRVSLDWLEGHVVGVVRDVETELGAPAPPKVYVSLDRLIVPGASLTVRAVGDAGALLPTLRAEIESAEPDIFLEEMSVLSQSLRTAAAPHRFNMWIVVAFAVLALTLAAVGIYGVTAFVVAERAPEIGIRRALGASDRSVVASVLGGIGRVTAVGVTLGLLGAVASGRMVSSLLVGVSPSDPAVLAGVVALLATVAVVASTVPVVRALRIDPTESLRRE